MWWPWLVVWIVTVLALLVAVAVFVLAWRSRHRFAPTRTVPGLTRYLNAKAVMDVYQVGGFGDAIVKEITHRMGVTKDDKVPFKGPPIAIGGDVSSEHEVVKAYVENYPPIAVVGALLDALEAADGVVHVDLSNRTIRTSTALERSWAPTSGTTMSQLRKLQSYVSVTGRFRYVVSGDGRGTVIFVAPIGDPDDSAGQPQVRVECQPAGLDQSIPIPHGPFDAVCLGRVHSWREWDQELEILPIAIFQ